MNQKTIFQKIIDREIPAKIEYEDDQCMVIHDITPKAPVHCLIIPKKSIARVAEAGDEDQALLGHLLLIAKTIAHRLKIDATGFRLVINNGENGGETVPHLHVHLLGGREMQWPPG